MLNEKFELKVDEYELKIIIATLERAARDLDPEYPDRCNYEPDIGDLQFMASALHKAFALEKYIDKKRDMEYAKRNYNSIVKTGKPLVSSEMPF